MLEKFTGHVVKSELGASRHEHNITHPMNPMNGRANSRRCLAIRFRKEIDRILCRCQWQTL